ncbi:MAG: flavin reductase [Bacteroidota bacterium]|nr:flavin reductase [Bacteroidota bacterium]
MINKFVSAKPEELTDNVFKLIGNDWMLITAGNVQSFNTMTASWGSLGILWNEPICICFIRPQRYTYEFMNNNSVFTLSFLDDKDKDILNFCGSHSGRDTNKIEKTSLLPIETDNGGIAFEQSKIIIEAQKIYFNDINPANFLDNRIQDCYPMKDFHRMFIGKITNFYKSKLS